MVQPGHRVQCCLLGNVLDWEAGYCMSQLCPRLSVNLDKLLTPRPPDLSLWKQKVVSIPCYPSSSTYLSAPRDTNSHGIPLRICSVDIDYKNLRKIIF